MCLFIKQKDRVLKEFRVAGVETTNIVKKMFMSLE